jgi:pyruvate,orthophosphate dikinase
MLQTRNGKRTGMAAVRIAVDLVEEGVIDKKTALSRVKPEMLNQFLFPIVDAKAATVAQKLATGLAAGPGAASGKVCFDPDRAAEWAEKGEVVILVRTETAPEDFHGMVAAAAILTARGGLTSHAAVVARQMGKCCVCGCGDIDIDYHKGVFTVGDVSVKEGDFITVDGHSGTVYNGQINTSESEVIQVIRGTLKPEQSVLYGYFFKFLGWADEVRTMGVRANADTPTDARVARMFGAQGIGLCRTEHMFFEGDRIDAIRQMIVASSLNERKAALAKVEPLQQADFEGLFTEMDGFPVTIRTLDPPLHEFLPHGDHEIEALAAKMGISGELLKNKVESLRESNPMLGFRGCRLGIEYPEITEMQARAIFRAVVAVKKRGITVLPEVMIPLVSDVSELRIQKAIVVRVAQEVKAESGVDFEYMVGTMLELPRACVTADKIAQEAEFFSFGTNDLTQTTLAISRDDYGPFIGFYRENDISPNDPFQTIDQEGVGDIMRIGVERGRSSRPDLKIGICGEHGGEPASVEFCHRIGLNDVSCSPFRVPIARLAAAHAAIKYGPKPKALNLVEVMKIAKSSSKL